MSMYSAFKTDQKKETEGVIVDFGNFRVTVRRAGGANKAFQKAMERIVAPYRRIAQLGTMQEGKMRELLAEGYAEAIITNWEYQKEAEDGLGEPVWTKGLELADGSIGEVTQENVKTVLVAQPDIFDMVKDVADNLRNYRTEDDEAAKGN